LEYLKNFDEQVHKSKQETLAEEEDIDEFEEYFKNGKEPKVLITTQYNAMLDKAKNASKFTMTFIKELLNCIPNSFYMKRKHYYVKQVIEYAEKNDFTDVIVIGERNNKPSSCLLIHLPTGPCATFRLSFPKLKKDLRNIAKVDRNYCQKFYPELILNNFTTRLGYRVARMFQAIFPQKPNFTGRRVVTMHNQRDFIFFRHHIYNFYDVDEKNKDRAKSVTVTKGVKIQEVGPRVTFRLQSLQLGKFDNLFGEFEWYGRNELVVDKKQF
ncbi:predicted protein, partial [Naegleria gruberi]